MFVELVYDKRNFDGLPGAKDIILGELSKRVHRIFPDADVRVCVLVIICWCKPKFYCQSDGACERADGVQCLRCMDG